MGSVVGYSSRGAGSSSSVGSGSGGGGVEDILKRLGSVEGHVAELRSQVSGIVAVIPHLATKADVMDLKSELSAAVGIAKSDLAAAETAIIKWIVATVLASAALAFTIAKFVH
jgi:hypothetical protein